MAENSMQPVIILPPWQMSPEDLQRLRDNCLCVVESQNPERVKFLDPIPAAAERGKIETAAIELSRKIMKSGFWESNHTLQLVIEHFFDILVKGSKLDPKPSQQEREQQIFDEEKQMEIRRLAREEAKAERLAQKEAAKASKK